MNSTRTTRNNSNKYIGFCLAYIHRDYFILSLNKLTLSLMTALIWCCVSNLTRAYSWQCL